VGKYICTSAIVHSGVLSMSETLFCAWELLSHALERNQSGKHGEIKGKNLCRERPMAQTYCDISSSSL
jgi:hypothetical protein